VLAAPVYSEARSLVGNDINAVNGGTRTREGENRRGGRRSSQDAVTVEVTEFVPLGPSGLVRRRSRSNSRPDSRPDSRSGVTRSGIKRSDGHGELGGDVHGVHGVLDVASMARGEEGRENGDGDSKYKQPRLISRGRCNSLHSLNSRGSPEPSMDRAGYAEGEMGGTEEEGDGDIYNELPSPRGPGRDHDKEPRPLTAPSDFLHIANINPSTLRDLQTSRAHIMGGGGGGGSTARQQRPQSVGLIGQLKSSGRMAEAGRSRRGVKGRLIARVARRARRRGEPLDLPDHVKRQASTTASIPITNMHPASGASGASGTANEVPGRPTKYADPHERPRQRERRAGARSPILDDALSHSPPESRSFRKPL
jgi:hypothetical protein